MLFHVSPKIVIEHDSGRKYEWMASVPGTSFRVYATTEKSAEKRLVRAIKLGLNALHTAGGPEGVKMYLDQHSIPYLTEGNLVTVRIGRGKELERAR